MTPKARYILGILATAGALVALVQGVRGPAPASRSAEEFDWLRGGDSEPAAGTEGHLPQEACDLFGDLLARGDLDTISEEDGATGSRRVWAHALRAIERRGGILAPGVEPALPFEEGEGELQLPWRTEPIAHKDLRQFCTADFNRDDTIDDADALAFLDEWFDRRGPLAPMLDIDRDGWLTDDDFSKFFESFDEGCEPIVQVALRNPPEASFELVMSRVAVTEVKLELRFSALQIIKDRTVRPEQPYVLRFER